MSCSLMLRVIVVPYVTAFAVNKWHATSLASDVAREQYKEKRYSAHHMDASTLHSDEGRSQLR